MWYQLDLGMWTPGASAAAGATALVAFTASWAPWLPEPLGLFADAVINEWIVWFTGLYLGSLALVSVLERLRPRPRAHPEPHPGIRPRPAP
ncbi:MAG TPA: hypothetical protein VFX49_13340 [Chloroflexota bacterium]|nr:hypothetical protein [Chloroflexota bacterium]